jgi:hypothetical protein
MCKSAGTTETELDAKSLNALIAEIDESLQEVDTTIVYPAPKTPVIEETVEVGSTTVTVTLCRDFLGDFTGEIMIGLKDKQWRPRATQQPEDAAITVKVPTVFWTCEGITLKEFSYFWLSKLLSQNGGTLLEKEDFWGGRPHTRKLKLLSPIRKSCKRVYERFLHEWPDDRPYIRWSDGTANIGLRGEEKKEGFGQLYFPLALNDSALRQL